MLIELNLLVLRCRNIAVTRQFYEQLLGINFTLEQHGQGLPHYASILGSSLVWELYPARASPDKTRLGFKLKGNHAPYVVKDPDGRSVEIS
jgi:catechol 2,3-dioxygenase-like lactoylglutathione lyase family enzyme